MKPVDLDPAAIRGRLRTRWIGSRVEVHPVLTSTMDRAADLARAGGAHGAVVVALRQTAGRGRQGRRWESPAGMGLYCSVVWEPRVGPEALPALAPATGLAVREAIERVVAVRVGLKWPNDIRWRRRKLGGVLAVSDLGAGVVRHVIVGIGLNLRQRPEDFPPELRGRATSLAVAIRSEAADREGAAPRLEAGCLLVALLEALESRWSRFETEGFEAMAREWERAADHLGETVFRPGPGGGRHRLEPVGIALGIDATGALLVRGQDGVVRAVSAGEVIASGDA